MGVPLFLNLSLKRSKGIGHVLVVSLEQVGGGHVAGRTLTFTNVSFPLGGRVDLVGWCLRETNFDDSCLDVFAYSQDARLVP